ILGLAQPAIMERSLGAAAYVDAVTLIALAVASRGHVRTASCLVVAAYIALVTALSLNAGGVRSPGIHSFLVFVLLATILLGDFAGVATALCCSAIIAALVVADFTGVLPKQTVIYGPPALGLIACIYMGLIVVLSWLAAATIRRALHRAEAELVAREA